MISEQWLSVSCNKQIKNMKVVTKDDGDGGDKICGAKWVEKHG